MSAHYLPWLAPFWIAGVLFCHLRGVASWLAARRLGSRGVCAATASWQSLLDRLAERMRLSRPVTLLESCLAEVPVVIGYVRPVILMPVGLLAGLPAAQVETILLHELAHIRRHDYLVNLLQIVAEGLVFYHPAVWWISGVIRAERENCCDDLVVATQGDAFAYATALTALEQNRGAVCEAVVAATGGSLVKRVRRLLVQPEGPRATLTPVLSAAILTIAAAAVLAAWQSTPPPRPPAPPAPPAVPAAPAPVAPPTQPFTPYTKWVSEDVAYIIRNDERATFKSLQSDAEREHFIEQFWQRRDPTPATTENEFKEEHYRRIAHANQNYWHLEIPGWKTDRGRIYIAYGPPDEKETHPSGGAYQRTAQEGGGTTSTFPFEKWRYRHIEGVGANVVIEFVDPTMTGVYLQTTDPSEKDALLRIPGDWPATNAGTPRAGATVQPMVNGATQISIPLAAYGDHWVNMHARISAMGRMLQSFEHPVQGPATYTKTVSLPPGSYRLEVVLWEVGAGKLAADSIAFEVK
ncbi:MAG: GWxTD domain-containing protein [Candidatus Solibacter sp.]|nr:GWxTD domain-containing protein [Candidatus Solibacter sp.]